MNTDLVTDKNKIRQSIMSLEERIREVTQSDGRTVEPNCPLKHHFAPGVYGREILIPMGMLVVGKIHKHAHINILSKGHVLVYTEDGPEEFEAPRTWISSPGTKRVVYAVTDVVWNTIHLNVNNETKVDVIEEFVIAKTFEEYEQFKKLSGVEKGIPCLT